MSAATYTNEIAETAESLVRAGPPPELNRAGWTLGTLAARLRACSDCPASINPETVRRLLKQRGITYRRAKEWLTSPDPFYDLHKSQRDRLLRFAREAADGAAVWLDQSWFSRWPYRYRAWAPEDIPLHVPKRWNERVETTALYAALDDESQEATLHWTEGQPNSEKTVSFLDKLMQEWAARGKGFIVLFWDRAPWHTSHRTRQWIRDYNRRAKREGLTRLLVCYHPARSPWLMPLEAIFGWIKSHVLGGRIFERTSELKSAVEACFRQRVPEAKVRRDAAWARSRAASAQKSTSVV